MSSLYQKRGYLHLDYTDEFGKKHTRNLKLKDTVRNRKKALKIKDTFEAELIKIKSSPVSSNKQTNFKNITIKEALYIYKTNIINTSESNKSNFKTAIKHFLNIADEKQLVSEITEVQLIDFIKSLQSTLANASLHTYIRYLKSFLNFLVEEEMIVRSPFKRKLMPKRVKSKIITFDDSTISAIIEEAEKRDSQTALALRLLSLTALRPCDAVRIKNGDIDFQKMHIRVRISKTGTELLFPLYKPLYKLLKGLDTNDKDKLLLSGMTVEALRRRFYRIKKKLGIANDHRITLKTYRKTFASNLAMAGFSPNEIADLLAHAQVQTARQYYILSDTNNLLNKLNGIKMKATK